MSNKKETTVDHTCINYPKQVTTKHYDDARTELISHYSDNKDVVAIYEYGSVSAPGVSDLDLIFVLKNQVNTDAKLFDLTHLSESVRALVEDGTVIKMPEEVFKYILYFDNLNLKILTGRKIDIINPNEQDDTFIKLASIVDWVPERILKMTRILYSTKINITNALCVLHSFSYSLHYLEKVLSSNPQSKLVIKKIAQLRGDWYTIESPEEALIQCLEQAIDIGYQRLRDYESFLISSDCYLLKNFNSKIPIDLELYKNHYIRFDNCDNNNAKEKAKSLCTNNKYYVVISHFYYPHFSILAEQQGRLASSMQNKMMPCVTVENNYTNHLYRNNLARKIALAEKNSLFLLANGFTNGLIRYGFHF